MEKALSSLMVFFLFVSMVFIVAFHQSKKNFKIKSQNYASFIDYVIKVLGIAYQRIVLKPFFGYI